MKSAVLISSLFFISCNFNKPDLLQKPIIQVNSSKLLASEFAQLLAKELRPFSSLALNNKEIIQRAKSKILNNYIVSSIHKEWAKTNNIFISNEELESQIQIVRGQYPDDTSFKASLTEGGQNLTSWKEDLRISLLQKKVHLKLAETLPHPTEEEIKTYYKNNSHQFYKKPQVKVQQIVLNSKHEAEEVLRLLRKGKKPDKLAKKFSITPESKDGGHLGWVEEESIHLISPPPLPRLRQWGPITKSPFGYHIFRILKKRGKEKTPFHEVHVEIKRILLEKKEQVYLSKWLEEQLQSAKIYKDEALIQGILAQTQGAL